MRKIDRFVAGSPFDVAADTGTLGRSGDLLPREHRVDRGSEITTRHGFAVSGTAVIELTAISERKHSAFGLAEKKKIRRTRGGIFLGDLLGVIVTKRKSPSEFAGHRLQTFGLVFGITGCIIGADGDDADVLLKIILPQSRKLELDVLDIRAVPAEEHHQQRFLVPEISRTDLFAGDGVFQTEIRRRGPQGDHHGRGQDHLSFSIVAVRSSTVTAAFFASRSVSCPAFTSRSNETLIKEPFFTWRGHSSALREPRRALRPSGFKNSTRKSSYVPAGTLPALLKNDTAASVERRSTCLSGR